MSFYVSRWPDQCDPRDGHMGHIFLNGIQTPPARIWFEERGPPTPVSNWTYTGPLGGPFALPEVFVPFVTAPCTPRFVLWRRTITFGDPGAPIELRITILKTERSLFTVDNWDSYWISLRLNGLESDFFIEHRQLSDTDYSRYQNNTPGLFWSWGGLLLPFQVVTWTEAWPIAWNRSEPGPPFLPDLPLLGIKESRNFKPRLIDIPQPPGLPSLTSG